MKKEYIKTNKDDYLTFISSAKEFILYSIERLNHGTVATMYSRYTGCYKEVTFVFYSKREMIDTLRNKYDCVIPREFC